MNLLGQLLTPVDDASDGKAIARHIASICWDIQTQKSTHQMDASFYYDVDKLQYTGSHYIFCLGMYISGWLPMCCVCLSNLTKRKICSRCNLIWYLVATANFHTRCFGCD